MNYVLHDPQVGACLRVAKALRLELWGVGSRPLGPDDRFVAVVDDPRQATLLVDRLRAGGRRADSPLPSLVVAWALPERLVASLLSLGLPVVVGSAVSSDPLAEQWDDGRFDTEWQLASALAELEEHVEC